MIPVGLDALRMWERWPYLRVGARTYLRSTYDRAGRNEAADASHFLYQKADDFNVAIPIIPYQGRYFCRRPRFPIRLHGPGRTLAVPT